MNEDKKLHIVGEDPRKNDVTEDTVEKKELWDHYGITKEEFAKQVEEIHTKFYEVAKESEDANVSAINVLNFLADNSLSEAARASVVLVLLNHSNELFSLKENLAAVITPIIGETLGPQLFQLMREVGSIKQVLQNATKK